MFPLVCLGKFIHCLPPQHSLPDTTNPHLEEKKKLQEQLAEAKKKEWSMPDWVVEEERERRKKKAAKKATLKKDEKKTKKPMEDDEQQYWMEMAADGDGEEQRNAHSNHANVEVNNLKWN